MNISDSQLNQIFPYARDQAGIFLSVLNDAMGHRQIVHFWRKSAMSPGNFDLYESRAANAT